MVVGEEEKDEEDDEAEEVGAEDADDEGDDDDDVVVVEDEEEEDQGVFYERIKEESHSTSGTIHNIHPNYKNLSSAFWSES